jgi:hypothetical protein
LRGASSSFVGGTFVDTGVGAGATTGAGAGVATVAGAQAATASDSSTSADTVFMGDLKVGIIREA